MMMKNGQAKTRLANILFFKFNGNLQLIHLHRRLRAVPGEEGENDSSATPPAGRLLLADIAGRDSA